MPHAGAARARRRGHPLPSPASRAAAPLGHPPAEAGAPVPPAGARIINPSLALTEYRPRAADPRATVYPSRLAHLAPSSLVTSPEAEPDPAPPVSPSENTHARQDTRCLAHSKHNSVARSRPHPQSSTSLVSECVGLHRALLAQIQLQLGQRPFLEQPPPPGRARRAARRLGSGGLSVQPSHLGDEHGVDGPLGRVVDAWRVRRVQEHADSRLRAVKSRVLL